MKLKFFVLQLISFSLLVFAVTDETIPTSRQIPKEGEELPYFPPEVTEKHPSSTILKQTTKLRTTDRNGYAGSGAKMPDRTPSTGKFKVEGRPDKDIPTRDAE